MQWFEKCILEMTHHNVFDTAEHRLRFRDLISCYSTAPFFNKALAKCMFLASRDEAHFTEMLDDLNTMTINSEKSLRFLTDRCTLMAQNPETAMDNLYLLAVSFITDTPYTVPNLSLLDADTALFIRQSLLVASIIDELPNPRNNPQV